MENEEASDEKEYSEEKNNDKYSTKFYHFNHKIPSLLSKTLNELIDCADDMVEALSSITMKQINRNENGNECVKENSYDNVNHIFLIPQLTNANEDVKKYTDFTIIGKKLLAKLKLSYH